MGEKISINDGKVMEENQKEQKLSYSQLENIAHQLSEQVRQLHRKLQESNFNNTFKRLDYLFKVVENEIHFPEEFRDTCINEIQELMTIPEDNKEEEKED